MSLLATSSDVNELECQGAGYARIDDLMSADGLRKLRLLGDAVAKDNDRVICLRRLRKNDRASLLGFMSENQIFRPDPLSLMEREYGCDDRQRGD